MRLKLYAHFADIRFDYDDCYYRAQSMRAAAQNTAMSANLVFINIDWKTSRMHEKCNREDRKPIGPRAAPASVSATQQPLPAPPPPPPTLELAMQAHREVEEHLLIDWKSGKMHEISPRTSPNAIDRNLRILTQTIAGVVRDMSPTMICMCKVGDTTHPLSEEQMQKLEAEVVSAWQNAATEHIQLCSMFTTGSPYMTVYIDGPIHCSNHQMLQNLYLGKEEPRVAQTFVCSMPDGESIDVINVHAPSGINRLKDSQRWTLLTNMLQSNSRAMPECTIGDANFLIGRDMNTGSCLMSQLLKECSSHDSLRTQTQIHEPRLPKH